MTRNTNNRTTVYVASIPGITQWSDDYESLADWAGGEEHVRLWDLTDRYACDGCGRHVTLMGNGYCGHCQDEAPETDRLGNERQQYNLNEKQKNAVGISEWVDLKRIGEEVGKR